MPQKRYTYPILFAFTLALIGLFLEDRVLFWGNFIIANIWMAALAISNEFYDDTDE